MSTRLQNGHFLGVLRSSHEMHGLTLAETEYDAGMVVPDHVHDHALCCLVVDGSLTERRGAASVELGAGSLIFHPPDEPHAHDFHQDGARCFNVQFGTGWVQRTEPFGLRMPPGPAALRSTRARWIAGQLYREFCTLDSASGLAIEGFALALLGELARSEGGRERMGARPRWLREAEEYLRAHFARPVSLTDLAHRLQVDPSHLARTFRQRHGCTMGEYLRRLRVEQAARELLATEKPLTAIALDAGFSDQAHLTRVFKQSTGMTPGSFRKTAASR